MSPSSFPGAISLISLRLATLAIAWIVACFATSPSALGQSDDGLVAGLVARYRAIYGGRFEYHRRAGFANKGEILPDETRELKYFETDWMVRTSDPPMVQLNHGGARLDIRYQHHSDRGVAPSVWVNTPGELDVGIEVPRFAGTLWYPGTVAFIEQHHNECKRVERREVAGVQVEVLEWEVSAGTRDAFGVMTPQLENGGVLRLSVASQLGFVLPLIEYVASDGRVAIDFSSSDFRQVGASLFWPWHCKRRLFTEEGKEGFFVEYNFTAAERVNEPIPGDEFAVDLPKGTYVNDVRPGANGAVYVIGESIVRPPIALPDGLDMKAPIVDRSWRTAALIGLAIAVGFLFAVYAAYFRHRKSA